MFGQSLGERGRRMDECLTVLQPGVDRRGVRVRRPDRARHAPPDHAGRAAAHVRRRVPAAAAPAGAVRAAGSSRRRGRPASSRRYHDECARLGNEPGLCFVPGREQRNVDIRGRRRRPSTWEQIGPFMLHDARMYALVARRLGRREQVDRADDRRTARRGRRVPDPHARRSCRPHPHARACSPLHPLCGGCPPDDSRGRRSSSSRRRCCPRSTN